MNVSVAENISHADKGQTWTRRLDGGRTEYLATARVAAHRLFGLHRLVDNGLTAPLIWLGLCSFGKQGSCVVRGSRGVISVFLVRGEGAKTLYTCMSWASLVTAGRLDSVLGR